jgi:hypothetical protein
MVQFSKKHFLEELQNVKYDCSPPIQFLLPHPSQFFFHTRSLLLLLSPCVVCGYFLSYSQHWSLHKQWNQFVIIWQTLRNFLLLWQHSIKNVIRCSALWYLYLKVFPNKNTHTSLATVLSTVIIINM